MGWHSPNSLTFSPVTLKQKDTAGKSIPATKKCSTTSLNHATSTITTSVTEAATALPSTTGPKTVSEVPSSEPVRAKKLHSPCLMRPSASVMELPASNSQLVSKESTGSKLKPNLTAKSGNTDIVQTNQSIVKRAMDSTSVPHMQELMFQTSSISYQSTPSTMVCVMMLLVIRKISNTPESMPNTMV